MVRASKACTIDISRNNKFIINKKAVQICFARSFLLFFFVGYSYCANSSLSSLACSTPLCLAQFENLGELVKNTIFVA